MSREEEYKQKCRQVKDYYLEEICEHEDAGCLGDAASRCSSRGCSRGIRWGALFHGKAM